MIRQRTIWTVINRFKNQYSRGTDQYPETVTEAYNLLVSYKKPENNRTLRPGGGNNRNLRPSGGNNRDADPQDQNVVFVQAGQPLIAKITCFNCQQMGHYAVDCTNAYKYVQRARAPVVPAVNLLMNATETNDYDKDDKDDEENGFSFNMIGGKNEKAHPQSHVDFTRQCINCQHICEQEPTKEHQALWIN